MTKHKWDIWEETQRKYGLYVHRKNGTIAIAYPPEKDSSRWTIDKGRVKAHPLLRLKINMVEEGTGNFFFNKSLSNYDLLDEGDYTPEGDLKPTNHAN